MIDAEAFCQADPTSRPSLDLDGRVEVQLRLAREDLLEQFHTGEQIGITERQALIAPATAPGFAFDEKIWARFHVNCLKPIGWESRKWDQLRLDSKRKTDIFRLVTAHNIGTNRDTAKIKGLGLVFLLFGPTGSGKSLTVGKLKPLMTPPDH
jgi:hypothetical protein